MTEEKRVANKKKIEQFWADVRAGKRKPPSTRKIKKYWRDVRAGRKPFPKKLKKYWQEVRSGKRLHSRSKKRLEGNDQAEVKAPKRPQSRRGRGTARPKKSTVQSRER